MIPYFSHGMVTRGLLALLLLLAGAAAVQAAPPVAEARQTIQTLSDALVGVMKRAGQLGLKGRAETLRPVVEASYDMPVMTRGALGLAAAKLSPADLAMLSTTFTHYTVATYAAEFDGYDGETFEVDAAQPSTDGAVVVASRIVPREGTPVEIDYLLRPDAQNHWRIVDVLLDGSVSQVAVRRSEFSTVLRRDGAQGLNSLMEQKTAALSISP